MRRTLLVVMLLLAAASPASADTVFPIEELEIVVRVPDGAGTWKIDRSRSKPGDAVLFDDDDAVHIVADDPAPSRSCRDAVEWFRQDQGATAELATSRGLDASWAPDAAFLAVPANQTDMIVACIERSGRQLLAVLGYPRDEAARARTALLLNSVAAAWIERADGLQRLQIGEYALTVWGREALWWSTSSDGSLLRLWHKPDVAVTFSRNRVSMISGDDSTTCASWMEALGKMYTPTPAASFVPAQWYPDAVVSFTDGSTLAVACLPRRGGGTMMAEILYRGDPATGDLDHAVRPLLAALAEAAGEPPAIAAAPVAGDPLAAAPAGYPDEGRRESARPRRSEYQAYTASSFTVSYLQLTPSLDGAEPSDGLTLGFDVPALPRDERGRGKTVFEAATQVGYDRSAGVVLDARAGVGYHLGSLRAAWIPLVGVGVDMIDHGAETAPFQASLAGYAYLAAILRYVPSERLAIEVRGAAIGRAGVYDEQQLSGRVTFLRGHQRKVSVEVGWRRFEADVIGTVGADVLSIGLGLGR